MSILGTDPFTFTARGRAALLSKGVTSLKGYFKKQLGLRGSYVASICVVILLIIVVILFSRPHRSFIATRIIQLPHINGFENGFRWLDNQTLLYQSILRDGDAWNTFNINDGSTVTLNRVTEMIHQNRPAVVTNGQAIRTPTIARMLSPSKQWLFVRYDVSNSVAVKMDGSSIVRPEPSEMANVFWLANDLGVVNFDRGHEARITWFPSNRTEFVRLPFAVRSPVGLRPLNEHLLTLMISTNGMLIVTEATFLSDPHIVEETTISLPPGAHLSSAEIAEDGSQIAWFQTRPRSLPSIQMDDSFPYFHLEDKKIWSLVVYDVQTHKAESLGEAVDFADATDLQWTVDSRSISFVIKGRLYIVKVHK